MIVHNISNISGKDAKKALVDSARRMIVKNYIYLVLATALGLPLLIYGIVTLNSQFISMGAIILAFALCIFIYIQILYIRTPKDIEKKNQDVIRDGIIYDFSFKERSVDVIIMNSGKKSKANYNYYDFKKVFEYDDHFEIRLISKEVILVLKDGFEGDKEKMLDFFRKNLSFNKKLNIADRRKNS